MARLNLTHPGQVDRNLALSFGAVVLALMLTVIGVATWLHTQLQEREEDRLAKTLGEVLAESISRISFSGKYHARLLVEEMAKGKPDLAFISVETLSGQILAHSDPARNDTSVGIEDAALISQSTNSPWFVAVRHFHDGMTVKEVILPYQGGVDTELLGVIRLGLNVDKVRQGQRANLVSLLLLITALTAAAIWAVLLLSRYFGGAMRELATRLQGILDHAPLGIRITDRAGQRLVQSVAFDRFCEAESAEATPSTPPGLPPLGSHSVVFGQGPALESEISNLKSPGHVGLLVNRGLKAGRLDPTVRQVFESAAQVEAELEVQLLDQARVWSVSAFPIARDRQGQVSLVCAFVTDITGRKRAEQALRENEHTFRLLFERSSDPILLLKNGRFVECNQAALALLGHVSRESFLGCTPADISPDRQPDDRTSVEAARDNDILALREGHHRFDWVCRRADGSRFEVEVALTSVTVRGESVLHVTWRDITERKQAEVERQKLQTQLRQAQKLESIGRLAGGVAHDFNNMLQVILGSVDLALNEVHPKSELEGNLLEIQKAAQRSANLTAQLLAFARKQTVNPRVLDLNETVTGMLRMLQRLIGEDIRLVWLPGEELWPIRMDPAQVDQILANLTVNARDAIAGVGTLGIRTANVVIEASEIRGQADWVPGDYVELLVEDTGPGIAPEIREHLFEPFFTTKDIGKGTGLGLATVFGIVKQNRGQITVQSEPNRGTTFRILLPRAPATPPQATVAPEPLSRGTETVLLVEDEETNPEIGPARAVATRL